jgi:hypothetical protein
VKSAQSWSIELGWPIEGVHADEIKKIQTDALEGVERLAWLLEEAANNKSICLSLSDKLRRASLELRNRLETLNS